MTQIPTQPIVNQKMGTSGLRRKVSEVMNTPHFLENFIQAVFNAVDAKGKTFVVGGDGRYLNKQALQLILKMAIANQVKHLIVGQDGLLSTPTASCMIRKYKTDGGFILSASHNPGGKEGDFGIKFDTANGGPCPEEVSRQIYEHTQKLTFYSIEEMPDIDIHTIQTQTFQNTQITVKDSVADYVELMKSLFDFDQIRALLSSGFRMVYDAMNAVTGPYAQQIFEKELGAPVGTVLHGQPLEDFGGLHPDPNLTYAHSLVEIMNAENAPDFGAASDGDGDRNMILGPHFFVNPSDSLAILLSYAAQRNPKGVFGVARSMPTSLAVDRVAKDLALPVYETPTGWKFFGHLLDAGRITLCGEESFGTGSAHIREKDGLWAILFWLSILAQTHLSVQAVVENMWKKYGRSYQMRYDFEGVDKKIADEMIASLRQKMPTLAGTTLGKWQVEKGDDFAYTDPVTRETTEHQGLRVVLKGGGRLLCRLSGTGTQGATVRVYVEGYEPTQTHQTSEEVLKPYMDAALSVFEVEKWTGRTQPSVIT